MGQHLILMIMKFHKDTANLEYLISLIKQAIL